MSLKPAGRMIGEEIQVVKQGAIVGIGKKLLPFRSLPRLILSDADVRRSIYGAVSGWACGACDRQREFNSPIVAVGSFRTAISSKSSSIRVRVP